MPDARQANKRKKKSKAAHDAKRHKNRVKFHFYFIARFIYSFFFSQKKEKRRNVNVYMCHGRISELSDREKKNSLSAYSHSPANGVLNRSAHMSLSSRKFGETRRCGFYASKKVLLAKQQSKERRGERPRPANYLVWCLMAKVHFTRVSVSICVLVRVFLAIIAATYFSHKSEAISHL